MSDDVDFQSRWREDAPDITYTPAWRSMLSAPKDGTNVLLVMTNKRVEIGYWDDDKYSKRPRPLFRSRSGLGVTHDRANQPVAWMALPQPPHYLWPKSPLPESKPA